MKKSIFVILTTVLLVSLTYHLAIADEKISPLTATASTSYWSYTPDKTVDGNMSTRWIGKPPTATYAPWEIKFDTGKIHYVTQIVIYWYEYGYAAGSYDIEISSDGNNWTPVYRGIRGVAGGEIRAINQNVRYIRLKIHSAQGASMPAIKEFEAYKSSAPANQPPTADANANPTSGVAPLTVQFTGSGTDPDGTIASYRWTFGDGGTSNQQNPSHTYNSVGGYTATLTVTDNNGATGTDSVTITVNEPPNKPPTAQPSANPTSGNAPLTVSFSGNGSDPDGTIVSYQWTFGDGGTSNQQNPSHIYNSSGTYSATLMVTDNDGATDSESITITVNAPPNQPPTANGNANPTSGVAPLTVQFTGSGADPDGTIVSYNWNFGDGVTSNEQNPPHTYQNPATYVAALTVTDDDGASDDAPPITITVTEPSSGGKIPHLIRFQGNLGDAEGVPLDGTFTLTFRLYDVETDGTPLWEEVQESIDIKDGVLDVKLGSVTALDLPFDRQYWLGVQVESDSEMSPRFELTTVPYAFTSGN